MNRLKKLFKKHKCPTKDKMEKLEKEIDLLEDELQFEKRRRQLAEWDKQLDDRERFQDSYV